MKTFLFFLVILALLVWGLRAWRRREQAAFNRLDPMALERLQQGTETAEEQVDPLVMIARQVAAQAEPTPEPAHPLATKPRVFLPDVDREFLDLLGESLAHDQLLLPGVELEQLLEGKGVPSETVPFVVCEKASLAPVVVVTRYAEDSAANHRVLLEEAGYHVANFPPGETLTRARVSQRLRSARP